MNSPDDLLNEAKRATEMLGGKVIHAIARHRNGEVGVQFTDGTRLVIGSTESGLELSITEGDDEIYTEMTTTLF